jgi:DNA-binding transcriptional regulator GbsR (MarR family)
MELTNTSMDHRSLNISEPTFQETILNVQNYANYYKDFHNALSAKLTSVTDSAKEFLDKQVSNEARAKKMSAALDEAIKEKLSKLEKKIEARNLKINQSTESLQECEEK